MQNSPGTVQGGSQLAPLDVAGESAFGAIYTDASSTAVRQCGAAVVSAAAVRVAVRSIRASARVTSPVVLCALIQSHNLERRR